MTSRNTKIAPALDSVKSVGSPEELVDVVVELTGDAQGGHNDIPALKAGFAKLSRPVSRVINDLGGEVLGEAWINRTLRARVPGSRIEDLSTLDEVSLVDVPHKITPD
jgi:hypothetical protein